MKFFSLLLSFFLSIGAVAQIMPGVVGSSQRFIQGDAASLPAADLWINGSDITKYSNSVEQGYAAISEKGRLIDQITTSDTHAYTSTALISAGLQYKPSYNGEAHFLNNQTGYTLGSASTFNALHNGTAFTIYLTFKQLPISDATTQWPMVKTIANTTTNSGRGLFIAYRNSTATSNLKTVRVAIMSGSGGSTGPFDVTCSSNSIIDNEYNTLKITFSGSALRVYIKNSANLTFTQIGSDLSGSGLSASDAAAVMSVGGSGSAWTGYLKQFIVYNRTLTSPDDTNAESWLDTETANQVITTNANIYFAWGQSNTAGNEPVGNLPVDVTGNLHGHIFYAPGYNDGGHQGYWDQYYVNVTTDPSNAGKSSAYQRFIKEMAAAGADPYLVIRGIGSTILIPNSGSWSSVSPVNSNDLYPIYTDQFTKDALYELIHVYRKTPVIRGMIKMQGETDAANNVTNTFSKYHFEWEQWCLNFTAYINNLGYSTNLMRIANPRVYNVAAAGWIATQSAETGIMDSLLIRNPSKTGSIRASKWIDTNGLPYSTPHYLSAGYDSIGWRLVRYYRQYYNESDVTFNIQNVTLTVRPNQYVGTNVAVTSSSNGATVNSYKWRFIRRSYLSDGSVDTTVVATSTSQNPSVSISTPGFYDVQLIARNASDKYTNYQTRYFVVLPARFTELEADVVIDMASGSQFLDYRGINMSDKKIYIKGQNSSAYLEMVDLHGTAGHPVRIQKSNDNIQVQFSYSGGSAHPWYFSQYGAGQGARYIIVDGFNIDGTPGIKVTAGAVSTSTIRVEGKLTDVAFYGVETQANTATIDGAAIAIVPTVGSTCNFYNWSANNIHVWHCVGTGGEEFAYIGESSQDSLYVGNNGYTPPNGIGLVLSRNRVDAAGRDGLQAASISGEAQDNYVANVGLQSDAGGQESCFVNNPGAGVRWSRNYCKNAKVLVNVLSGLKPWSPGAGQSVPQSVIFENNVLINGTFPTATADEPYAIFIQNNPSSGAGDWTVEFKNNTIVSNKKGAQFTLALGGFTSKNFVFANNIVIKTGTAGDYAEFDYTGNGDPSLISGVTINNQVLNNGDDLGPYRFNNPGAGDYSVTSLLSTAYTGSPGTISVVYDFQGFPIPVPVFGFYYGAYSNYSKRIIAP